MPRRPRLRIADLPYHVVQRGNNRNFCFLSDRDRLRYLDELTLLSRSHDVAVHAYVLMSNHIHLLVTPRDPDGVPTLMKFLGQRYAQYFNRVHNRTGAFWEGRYYASLVDSEQYLLTSHRYIESNPVRAGMVDRPDDYRWSSFAANAAGTGDALVSLHPIVAALGSSALARGQAYRTLFEQDLSAAALNEMRATIRGGFAVGTVEFKERMALSLGYRTGRVGSGRKRKGV